MWPGMGQYLRNAPSSPIGGNVSNPYASATTSHQLQSTVSASTSGVPTVPGIVHHPITCTSKLYFEEDGRFACEHAEVPAGDERTQACLHHSMALLVIELGLTFSGMEKLPFDRYEEQEAMLQERGL